MVFIQLDDIPLPFFHPILQGDHHGFEQGTAEKEKKTLGRKTVQNLTGNQGYRAIGKSLQL
jgi:hypothetical protein